jgi:hypothetical protein
VLKPDQQRFLFDARGIAFSATVHSPFNEIVESQAATTLSVDGGASKAKKENFNYRDVFSFAKAETFVAGTHTDHDWETIVTTQIEKLNIVNMITADAVVSRLVARQVRVDAAVELDEDGRLICKAPPKGPEPTILPLGSYFVNLRIAGVLVETEAGAAGREELATFSKAAENQTGDIVQLSIFDKVTAKGLTSVGKNIFDVPGFGRVILGELMARRHERRLTMIRAELGCPLKGTVSAATSHGGGSPFPPYSK